MGACLRGWRVCGLRKRMVVGGWRGLRNEGGGSGEKEERWNYN